MFFCGIVQHDDLLMLTDKITQTRRCRDAVGKLDLRRVFQMFCGRIGRHRVSQFQYEVSDKVKDGTEVTNSSHEDITGLTNILSFKENLWSALSKQITTYQLFNIDDDIKKTENRLSFNCFSCDG